MKRLILFLAGLSLVSCDSGTKEAEGTSSETQSALQALADSLATVSFAPLPEAPSTAVAARALVDTGWLPKGYSRKFFEYGGSAKEGMFSSWRRMTARPEGNILVVDDTSKDFSPEMELTRRWRRFETGPGLQHNPNDSRLELDGLSRSGFHYTARNLVPADLERLPLDSLGLNVDAQAMIYTFEGGWTLVLPDQWPFGQPVFRNGILKGWLVQLGNSWSSFITDFSNCGIRGLDGTLFVGRALPNSKRWRADSIGLFYGEPRPDSSGTKLLIPYRWRFHPGTIAALSGTHPILYDVDKIFPLRVENFVFPSDSGEGIAIAFGAIRNGKVVARKLNTSWNKYSDSGSIWSFTYPLYIPETPID